MSSNLFLVFFFLGQQDLAAGKPLDLVKHAIEEGLFDVLRQQVSHIEAADHYIFLKWYEEAKDLAVHVVVPQFLQVFAAVADHDFAAAAVHPEGKTFEFGKLAPILALLSPVLQKVL